jgi:GNAT superfamily N-acetyltransferase
VTRGGEVDVRPTAPEDGPAILQLLRTSLTGAGDERYPPFIDWKHRDNAFGPSPAWVATTDGRIVGYRSFMRWEFESIGGEVVRTVRAVDTVTHPDVRGQGIFSRLTLAALDDLTAEGVAFVFNMPNDRSGPGYLKMGWLPIRHPTVFLRPKVSARSVRRTLAGRGASERWSLESTAGVDAPEFLRQPGLDALLASQPRASCLRTRLTPGYLRWRYGLASLAYRCLPAGDGPEDGFAVFRIHRRGQATELVVCDVLVPGAEVRRASRLLRKVGAISPADHAITVAQPGLLRSGFLPLPGKGATLMWRPLGQTRPPEWALTMGDLEIF